MNRPCSRAVVCPGPQPGLEADSPVTNYSSEYNDGVEFTSYPFPPGNPYDPRIPKWWADSCIGTKCVSTVSQQAADDCAAALMWLCVTVPPRDPDPPEVCIEDPELCTPVGPEMFPNQAQTASFACPDGTLFYWTIGAGTIYSQSTAMANAIALALAQKRVSENFICFSALTNQPCLDVEYTDLIVVDDGNFQNYTFSIIGGDLPPGLVLTNLGGNQASITGTALFSGIYMATIRATASNGNFADKTYTFSVIGLTNFTPLTEATIGVAYSEQLNVDGGVAPFTFTLLSGTLPAGLTLSNEGLISGTPTAVENASFTVSFSDSNGGSCTKAFELSVICLITTVSLANGTDGAAYSQALTANGGTAPFVWSIVAGALPSGLSLNASTGAITGTPDTVETANFTVQLLTQEITCEKELSITIEAGGSCPDFTQIIWGAPSISTFEGNTFCVAQATWNPTMLGSVSADVRAVGDAGSFADALIIATPTLAYNSTSNCNCQIDVTVTGVTGLDTPSAQSLSSILIGTSPGGSDILSLTSGYTSGSTAFVVPSSGGANATLHMTLSFHASSNNAAQNIILTVDAAFSNV